MPKRNIIQFSLAEGDRKLLERYVIDGESLGLTAKRIIIAVLSDALDVPPPPPEPIEVDPQLLLSLQSRIESLEKKLNSDLPPMAIMVEKRHKGAA